MKSTFLQLLTNELAVTLKESQIEDWKETLCVILTSPDHSETHPLASQLGEKLIQEKNDTAAALACFILAEDTDRAIQIWVDEAKERVKKKPATYLKELAVVVLKAVMLKAVVGNTRQCPELERLAAEFVRAELAGNFELAKNFIEKLPVNRPESFELKSLYDRIMGLMRLERPQLWEVEVIPSHKPKPSQKPVKVPESTNPFTGKAGPIMKAGPPKSVKVNPFPSDSESAAAKNPFPSTREDAKESIPTIPKTEPFKRVPGPVEPPSHQVQQSTKVAPPPMPIAKTGPAVPLPVARPEDPNRPKTSPFGGLPDKGATPEVAQPPKQVTTRAFPPPPTQNPSASVPDIPKTASAQPMKTTPPPLAVVPKQTQPGFRVPPPPRVEPPTMAAASARSIPAEYSLIYQVWSQAPNFPYVNARLKTEADTKLEELYRKLESGEMAAAEADRVLAMTQAFHTGDCQTALSIQMELVKSAWEANKTWLPVVKNLIKAKQQNK